MTDGELADEIIARLNRLLSSKPARHAISAVYAQRFEVFRALVEHPTIQVRDGETPTVSALGILNGLVGVIENEGNHKGYGFITLVADEDTGRIDRFERTKET